MKMVKRRISTVIHTNGILIALMLCFLLSCQEKKLIFQVNSNTKQMPLVDENGELGNDVHVSRCGNDSLIVQDKESLKLFVQNKFVKHLMQKGPGACEYQHVYAYKTLGDTLIVFDRQLSKLLLYSIKSNTCIREIILSDMSKATLFSYCNEKIYFFRTNFNNSFKPEEPLAYVMNLKSDTSIKPLDFTFAKINKTSLLNFTIKIESSDNVACKGSMIYFSMPLQQKIFSYNFQTNSFSEFEITLNTPQDVAPGTIKGLKQTLEYIQNTEIITGIFPLNERIAIVTKQGKQPNIHWAIKFYSFQGDFEGELPAKDYVVDVSESSFLSLALDVEGKSKYPYSIVQQFYSVSKK
jgi:hypothetical protein